jgi:hypothetical protein
VNEEALNTSVCKFLRKFGVIAQRELETAVRAADANGQLKGSGAELHFADVEPVAQEIGERASGEGDTANGPLIRELADFGDDSALPKVASSSPILARSRYRRRIVRTRSASSSSMKSFLSRLTYPRGTMPPTHNPLRLEAPVLSRMRSLVTSRSNWGKRRQHVERQSAHGSGGIELLSHGHEGDGVGGSSTGLAKSASERVSRSTL